MKLLNHYPDSKYHLCDPIERKCVNALTIWLTIKKQITENHKTQHVKYSMQKCSFGESGFKFLSSLKLADAKIEAY